MVTQATVLRMQQLYAADKEYIDNAIAFSADNFERSYTMLIRDIALGVIKPTESLNPQQQTVASVSI